MATLLLGMLAGLSAPWQTAQAACQRSTTPPELEVNIVPWQIRYDYTRSQAELSALVERHSWLSAGHSARGLYQAELMHRYLIEFDEEVGGWTSPNCLAVSRVAVDLTYFQPTIFLAKELAWARCVAIEVRKHEQKHARVDRDMMDWLGQLMRGELVKWVGIRAPTAVDDLETAKARHDAELKTKIEQVINLYVSERNKRQLAIDTPEEYARIDAACPHN
ncbi:MAG: hypothetical protein AAF213_11180 [Pseudomonadota bacterium]